MFLARVATHRVFAIFCYVVAIPFIIVEVSCDIYHASRLARSVVACGRVTPVGAGDPSSSVAQ